MTIINSTSSEELLFYVNGKRICLINSPHKTLIEPETTLLAYLRNELKLTGTKLGCAEGGCGACTVMLSHYEVGKKAVVHRAINACLMPLCAVAGMHVSLYMYCL